MQFVTVTDGGWDTHHEQLQEPEGPAAAARWTAATSALLEDLHARGLLDETLVVWFGDFGRTPKVNPSAGRDHWARPAWRCMAGGGLKIGQVVGATNALGEFVTDSPVTPAGPRRDDLHRARRAAAHVVQGPGRPADRAVPEGKPVKQLL